MSRKFILNLLIVLAVICGVSPAAALASPASLDSTRTAPVSVASSVPDILFVENAGQWADDAQFQTLGTESGVWLEQDAIWLTIPEGGENTSGAAEPELGSSEIGDPRARVNIRLSFPGSNPSLLVEPFGRMETKVSYFLGSDPSEWRADVPVWSGVRYKDIYPGVDLELRGDDGKLSMNWVVTNDGGPASLQNSRLKVEGGEIASVANGIVELETAIGRVDIPLPKLERDMNDLVSASRPSVLGNEIAAPFTSGAEGVLFNAINNGDTGLIYSTFLGGSQWDLVLSVTVDDAGACYAAGHTESTDFPSTPGVIQPTNKFQNAFIVKLNPTGSSLEYATYLGGEYQDTAMEIKVDDSGNAYVAGSSNSWNFPTTASAYCSSNSGSNDVFLAKLNSTATSLDYSTYFGGSNTEIPQSLGMTLSGDGVVCIATGTASADFPVTENAIQTTVPEGWAGAVFSLDTNLTGADCLLYSTLFGYYCNDVAVSSEGKIYATGAANIITTTEGAFDRSFTGDDGDAFFAVFDPAAATGPSSLLYSTYLGGSGIEVAYGLALDSDDNAYITGWTTAGNFPVTPGAYDSSFNGVADVFVVKVNPAGNGVDDLVYGTFVGGSDSWEESASITVDSLGAAYVTGYTTPYDPNGSIFPTTDGAYDRTPRGSCDAFAFRLNPSGSNLSYSTYLGGGGDDKGYGIALDSSGGMYIGGMTGSPADFPTTGGAAFPTSQGWVDGFVTKLVATGDLEPGIIAPAAGEAVASGSLYQLKWVGPEGAKTFKIKYSTDKGKTWKLIAKNITETAYSWSVPEPLNNKNNCIFKVQSFTETGVALPVFKSPFIIEVVKLTSPEGPGLTLTSGTTAAITWSINDTAKPIKKVKLTWTKDGGTTWLPIAGGAITDTAVIEGGTFSWTVPYVGTASKTKCKVMVKLLSSNGTVIGKDTSDANFVIEAVPVVVSSPNGGEEIWAASTQEISWSAPLNAEKFKLEYSTNNGTTWKLIEKDVTGTSYDWTLPTQDGNKTNSRVKVTGYTSAGAVVASDKSDSVFTIQTLKLTAPNSGNPTISTGDSYTVTWETNGLKTEPAKVKLTYSKDGGATWLPVDGGVITDPVAIASGTFNWTVPSVGVNPKTKCKVMVKLISSSGVVLAKDKSDSNFTISPWR